METINKTPFEPNSPQNLAVAVTRSLFMTSYNDKNSFSDNYPVFKMGLVDDFDPFEKEDAADPDSAEPTDDDINGEQYEDLEEADDDDFFIDVDEDEGFIEDRDPSTDDLGKRSDYID